MGVYRLYGVSPSDGSTVVVGSTEIGGHWRSPSVGANGTIYVVGSSRLLAYGADGLMLWEYVHQGNFAEQPGEAVTGVDGRLHFSSFDYYQLTGRLHALMPDGSISWVHEFPHREQPVGSPAIGTDGSIYVASAATAIPTAPQETGVMAFSSSGSFLWSLPDIQPLWTYYNSPIIGTDGTLYILGYESTDPNNTYVYAIETACAGPAFSAWPMVGANAQHTHVANIPSTQMPVFYQPDNFGWKFMSYADYRSGSGQTYYVYHPAADLNVAGDESGKIPVYAIADGEIAANSKTWGGIVLKHNIAGQAYYSQYGHLKHLKDESQLQFGKPVKRGDQIGFIGNVGKVPYHLHFEIRSPYHPNPTYAPYWDNTATVLPDKLSRRNVFIGYESPLAFVDTYTDPNATVVIIDDGVTYPSIAQDIVDNMVRIDVHKTGIKEIVKKRFFRFSKLDEWHPAYNGENAAYEGNYHYALSTPDSPTAYGRWYFDIPVAGKYEVLVSIPWGAETKQTRYAIYHNNRLHYVTADQSAVSAETDISKRWLSLGTFVFQQGSKNWVHLSNKTGETNLKIGYDALKLIKK